MSEIRTLKVSELEKEHLSVLRELGRRVGVKCPASKAKDKLIKEIIDIQAGKKPAHKDNAIKRGAPTKIKVDISKYLVDNETPYQSSNVQINQVTLSDCKKFNTDTFEMTGCLDINVQGFGFIRAKDYENSLDDVYVSMANIKKYNLRRGDKITAKAKRQKESDVAAALQEIVSINGMSLKELMSIVPFDDLVPCYPIEKIGLESKTENDLTLRCIDLFAPIGLGQRGLIVAPPKTGKTTLIKKIAQAVENSDKNVKLIVLLVDERPEEVTDIKRSINSEVIFSTFDESAENHVAVAEKVIERAKRQVERGENVIILMDSITRLVRAYNATAESSGKTLSGGLDPLAMHGPKRFFGAARNIENGGSLTIVATALVETGSRMDDVIYEEFKGTGNMEIYLSRNLSEKRIFPAIDLYKSGTRKDELLLTEEEYEAVFKLRKILSERADATDGLLDMLKKTKNNAYLIAKLDGWLKLYAK